MNPVKDVWSNFLDAIDADDDVNNNNNTLATSLQSDSLLYSGGEEEEDDLDGYGLEGGDDLLEDEDVFLDEYGHLIDEMENYDEYYDDDDNVDYEDDDDEEDDDDDELLLADYEDADDLDYFSDSDLIFAQHERRRSSSHHHHHHRRRRSDNRSSDENESRYGVLNTSEESLESSQMHGVKTTSTATPQIQVSPAASPPEPIPGGEQPTPVKKKKMARKNKQKIKRPRRRRRVRKNHQAGPRYKRHYEFSANSNVVGVAFLEVNKVEDLPPERNVTRTGFDMDPFIVVSFGKKTFRTQWRRHTLNPVFNEKMLFPIHKHERSFSVNFTVMDKDRFSLNDFVADANLEIADLLKTAPEPDAETGLYKQESLVSAPLVPGHRKKFPHRLQRKRGNSTNQRPQQSKQPSGASTPPSSQSGSSSMADTAASSSNQINTSDPMGDITVDDDDEPTSPVISNSELQNFHLKLNLKHESKWESTHNPYIHIRGRFLPYAALRQHFWRGIIRLYDIDDTNAISYIELGALLDSLGSTLSEDTKKSFFRRFDRSLDDELTVDEVVTCLERQVLRDSLREKRLKLQLANKRDTMYSDSESVFDRESAFNNHNTNSSSSFVPGAESDSQLPPSKASYSSGSSSTFDLMSFAKDSEPSLADERGVEHVLRINTCPVCNQPRLKKRSELDIVTHLAICASQNWAKVDALVMDRYVTSNQARKRWYSKVVSKVSYGNYKLGANSANILVQDRITGYVMEEKMSAYVRLGIRLLYKGMKSSRRMETKRIRNLLRSLSIKQGRKYDSPSSVQSIMHFIKFHNIDMEDVLEPVENFKSFNEFFYRKLKPGVRKCDAPDRPEIAVSPADCRTTVFNTVSKATEVWIKGREFSIARLFGDAYPDLVEKFIGGSLGIFRLAPQDYHRFHIPVDGILGKPKAIEGEYYTVNPMAIRSSLDVYGENVRVLVPIESEAFGTVMVVCVGAMMVGSTVITAEEGSHVQRLDELGYFQFGGSTLVVLFEPNQVEFDGDLVDNSIGALETLVRVGMSIGHSPDTEEFEGTENWKASGGLQKSSTIAEAKAWAASRINGGTVSDDDEKS